LDNVWSKFPGFDKFMADKKKAEELRKKLAEVKVMESVVVYLLKNVFVLALLSV
jgi:hypothetical protein